MMLNWSQRVEGHETIHVWPWDDQVIDSAEYERSLWDLQRFVAEVDVSKLYSLEDVSAVASLVGHNVRVLVISRGKKIERKSLQLEPGMSEPISYIEREYVYNASIEDREIVVTASEGYSWISERRIVGYQRYQREELRVALPSDRDIALGNTPNVEEQSLYGIDLRGGKREYRPVKEPENAQTQQGFTCILKDAIREVLSLLN